VKIDAMAAATVIIGTLLARPILAATHADAAFKKLQALDGEWEGKDEKGKPAKTSFKVIVSKTGVLETLYPGDMEQMVTVYSRDGDGIALIHFCPTNNQPRMRAVPTSDDVKELAFDFQGAGNLPSPNAGHQHHLVIRFEDADHITETWTWRENGMDMPMVFHFSRKKK
jgi:hypothetical protein